MNKIYIEHNPFIVETHFLINGSEPAEGCKLSSYKELRLQMWVESIFEEFSRQLNGETHFSVEFKGVESDYMDILDAAEAARADGMEIEVEWLPVKEVEHRLSEIQSLMEQAKQNPQFNEYIENNESVSKGFQEAFNRDFNLYVVATMSSGKSTLINAMLGQDLLPAANEATTATIAQITDDKTVGSQFMGRRIDADSSVSEEVEVTSELLKEWNMLSNTRQIDLRGDIVSMQERENVRLVLTDTPGPNNSQDEDHERVTMSFIQDSYRNPLILYVLNASQLGINDDQNLLRLVAQTMARGGKQSKDRFIFAVNKMDNFDPENGENVSAALERVKAYLENNGVPNPQVYPISANLTRLLRKNPDDLTRKERGDLNTMTELFLEEASMNLPSYMPLTSRVSRALEERKISSVERRSGLPAVEVMIDEYIEKYTFPNRLKRAYDALNQAIEKGMREAELTEQLEQDEQELALLNEQIEILQQRRKEGANTESYKQELRHRGKELPQPIANQFTQQMAKVSKEIAQIGAEFQKNQQETPNIAERILDEAKRNAEFLHKELVNDCENAFQLSQELIKKQLHDEYKQYIGTLFDDARTLNLPVLQGLKEEIADFSLNLNLNSQHVKSKQERYNPREVSDSSWWNPFSWGRTRTVWDYRDVKYVDMVPLWDESRSILQADFMQLLDNAKKKTEQDKNKLVESYLAFIDREFESKFNQIIDSLKEKLVNQEAREIAIAQAHEQKAWIKQFKAQLDQTLSV
ncbi:dynamin family protein [Providencia stuartii]|uniref:Dynamin family protein n=1 Tax=Providencia stuartii TaxID=588 RepID=A0AAI9D803_PROST|nr:dynamin family protein [Providencia sp. 2023EL-00965]ELR5112503.1 dynamin family protein [Providencia stuartii]ELR5299392.1 dynamin family protein [Providencia stuartii]MDW7588466.1 dynamin family protein [Providencia sp. 2023EL-00965]